MVEMKSHPNGLGLALRTSGSEMKAGRNPESPAARGSAWRLKAARVVFSSLVINHSPIIVRDDIAVRLMIVVQPLQGVIALAEKLAWFHMQHMAIAE